MLHATMLQFMHVVGSFQAESFANLEQNFYKFGCDNPHFLQATLLQQVHAFNIQY